jgi:hypothetical protein
VATKKPADVAKAKAAKQKKMVIALSAVLVLAMGYAVKRMSGMKSSGSQPVAAPVASSTTPAVPVATPVAAPTLAGTSSPLAAAPIDGARAPLVSVAKPAAQTGQLQSFSLFESKDPFHNGGSASGGGAAKPPVKPPAPPTPPATPGTPAKPTTPAAPAVTTAVISVNGAAESVSVGAAFPAANPVFQVVSLTAKTATITIVGGSYASGTPTLKLRLNTPVTLQNTADGTKYTLLLLPQGTQAASGTASGGTTAPPATPATPTTPTTPTAPTTPTTPSG